MWRHCVQCFDCFGLAALIDEQVLCVHGGLSPDVRTLDQVRAIDRNQEIPHEGAFCDLVWSDPEDIAGSWQLTELVQPSVGRVQQCHNDSDGNEAGDGAERCHF